MISPVFNMENAITDFMSKIVPELGKLLSDIKLWLNLAMFIPAVLFLLMGAFYIHLSPKEANHKAGYRTFFGMGSVNAWKYTQKIAGIVWGAAGGLNLILAIIGCIIVSGQAQDSAASAAQVILIIQAVCAVLAFLAVEILTAMKFDANGNPRVKVQIQ